MRFEGLSGDNRLPDRDLTWDDVFLVPQRSDITSRFDVDLTPADGTGMRVPIVGANMTAVSGRRMAATLARRGGMAVFPQDLPAEVVAAATERVKSESPVWEQPITVSGQTPAGEALALLPKRRHGAAVVVDQDNVPSGIVSRADLESRDRFAQVHTLMSTDLVTIKADTSPRDAYLTLHDAHLRHAPVVDGSGVLVGIASVAGCVRSTVFEPALDANGRLLVGAAIGISKGQSEHARELVSAGVDVLVIDTAHGHQERMLKQVEAVADMGLDVPIVAGNVVTAGGVRDLVSAGASIIKVGVGPGAMCTTRMMTGVGRPQLSAVLETAATARSLGAHVWADGGIRHPRDVALALAAGASAVMIGSWFAGTHESPGDMLFDADGRAYKESFGMASARAVKARTAGDDAFSRARKAMFEEGISTGTIYLDPQRPSVEDLVDTITAGVRSACTYTGATNLLDFHETAILGLQSQAGFAEGRPRAMG